MADAVVVPGRSFGPGAGMLMYAAAVAEHRGATVHRHTWLGEPPDPFQPAVEPWVRAEVTPLLDELGGTPLVIAKSLGTNAAGLVAERGLPAVWLTPVLTMDWIVAGLDRATAPFLLVGGTGDGFWDGAVARRLTPHVFEVEGANHGMFVPGPVADSVEVLSRMITAIDDFLTELAW